MKIKKVGWVALLVLGLVPVLPAEASSTLTVTLTNYEIHEASGCAGSQIQGYTSCGDPILPVTDGTAQATQSAAADGSFALQVAATNGNAIEQRYASSNVYIETNYLLDRAAKNASLLMTYRVDGGSVSKTNFGNAIANGFVSGTSLSGRPATLKVTDSEQIKLDDADCSDGARIQVSGQYLGTNFYPESTPGTYTLRVGFSCANGALIQPNQVFRALLSAGGSARTSRTDDAGAASLAGQILSVTWTFTIP